MSEEIRTKLALLEKKICAHEVGSVQHNMYMEIMRELEAKLELEPKNTQVKLHKDNDTTCEACQ